ncbi:RICIN domain-containing protein [Streptomyces sp. NPDC050982]|uniref:RICIN domain-containing protein n=1 Tax=Streptomyces sp. NPDC050982 TaxID=3154746 RepID=UPI00340A8EF3
MSHQRACLSSAEQPHRLKSLWVLIGILALALSLTAPTAHAATTEEGGDVPVVSGRVEAGDVSAAAYLRIANYNSRKCLVAQGPNNGAPAFQTDCASFIDQYWQLESVGTHGGYTAFRIRNYNSGKCLVVQGPNNGSQGFQFDCASFVDQYWWPVIDTTGNYMMLQNVNSGKCLVVQGTANGSRAFQFDCHSEFADQWWYRP